MYFSAANSRNSQAVAYHQRSFFGFSLHVGLPDILINFNDT